MLNEKQT